MTELLFETREAFHFRLSENAETAGGVWLVFGKDKSVKTLKAQEALEEALCFRLIDDQMQKVDGRQYAGMYFDAKSEEARARRLEKIIGRLDQNLKPV